MNMFRQRLIFTAAVVVTGMAGVCYGEEPSVTPYRPTVSNPAALSAPGWLEMELGANSTRADDSSREQSLPYLFKYAFTPDFGVLLGGDSYLRQTDPDGARSAGFGDTTVMLKHHWALGAEEGPALGLEWGFKAPTAKTGLGSGKADWLANAIYSAELANTTLDLNVNATRIGAIQTDESRTQIGWAAALSHPLAGAWGAAVELSGSARRGTTTSNQFLAALNYSQSARVVFDFGMAAGLGPAPRDKSVFAGVSLLLEKIH